MFGRGETLLNRVLGFSLLLIMLWFVALFSGCADYDKHEQKDTICFADEPRTCPEPKVCETCETCPEPEVCETCPEAEVCEPPEDPCDCVDFGEEGSEEEEQCLAEYLVRHGLCGPRFDIKLYCPNPEWPSQWRKVTTWIEGCTQDQPSGDNS